MKSFRNKELSVKKNTGGNYNVKKNKLEKKYFYLLVPIASELCGLT